MTACLPASPSLPKRATKAQMGPLWEACTQWLELLAPTGPPPRGLTTGCQASSRTWGAWLCPAVGRSAPRNPPSRGWFSGPCGGLRSGRLTTGSVSRWRLCPGSGLILGSKCFPGTGQLPWGTAMPGRPANAVPAPRPWCPRSAGISSAFPGGGCLLQHLLNLGLGLRDSFQNLLCFPPPGVCSHSIFILCFLRLTRKALEPGADTHTPRRAPAHLPQVSSGLLSDQARTPPPLPVHAPSPTLPSAATTHPGGCTEAGSTQAVVAVGKEGRAKPCSLQGSSWAEPWPNIRALEFRPRFIPTLLWGLLWVRSWLL